MLDLTSLAAPPDWQSQGPECDVDAYFSADIETDGPIPGPYSMLSFALAYAGSSDGKTFVRPPSHDTVYYAELQPISDDFQVDALKVNGLDRERLILQGQNPREAMNNAGEWIRSVAGKRKPVLVAYPLSFDWAWLYWYFVRFSDRGSPFGYSRCYDMKTAFAIKSGRSISEAGRSRLPAGLASKIAHTHHALDDAIEQAEIFANIQEWKNDK